MQEKVSKLTHPTLPHQLTMIFKNLKINQLIESSTIEPPDVLQEQAKKKE